MDTVLQIQDITKRFPGITALHNVSVGFHGGTVHALVGENGAGKTTLVKIISGAYAPDQGSTLWRGKPVHLFPPSRSQGFGIASIHQQRMLVSYFTGYENLYLGRRYPKRKLGILNWKKIKSEAEAVKKELGVTIDLHSMVSELTPAHQTLVEVMRALMVKAQLIILDEPTASLSNNETTALFSAIRRLRANGTSFIYVSHRLEEIFEIADQVTVLRNGRLVATMETVHTNKAELIKLMAGERTAESFVSPPSFITSQVLLSVRDLSTRDGKVKNVSLDLHRHEILGLFGLVGAGRTEFLECLYGIRLPKTGKIWIDQQPVHITNPTHAVRAGLALIPEDRFRDGIIPTLSVRENLALPMLERFRIRSWLPIPDRIREKRMTKEMIHRLQLHTRGPEQVVSSLSGGNQQKVVLAKWIACGAKVFLCDEPTQGVDVNARREIYQLLYRTVHQGAGVLLVSSDLSEIMAVSHRIGVMGDGRLITILPNKNLTPEKILAYCYGGVSDSYAG